MVTIKYAQYFIVLGIQPTNDIKRIKAAYRKKCLQTHPDKGGTDEAFRRVNETFERLINLAERGINLCARNKTVKPKPKHPEKKSEPPPASDSDRESSDSEFIFLESEEEEEFVDADE